MIKVWDMVGGAHPSAVESITLRGHRGGVKTLEFSPDGGTLISTGGILGSFGEVLAWRAGDVGLEKFVKWGYVPLPGGLLRNTAPPDGAGTAQPLVPR